MTLFAPLATFARAAEARFEALPPARRESLQRLAAYVGARREAGEVARLVFICTHNSRRSHISQLWAAAAALHYGVAPVETYSGGTEATAFNPRAVAAMRRVGFAIEGAAGDNPRHEVRFAADAPAEICYSKVFDDPANPQRDFAAVMTCTQADEACPMVPGAAARFAIPWDDPKAADDTPEEAARYDERVAQIGTELLYVFAQVATRARD